MSGEQSKCKSIFYQTSGYFWLDSSYDVEACGQWDADMGHVELLACEMGHPFWRWPALNEDAYRNFY